MLELLPVGVLGVGLLIAPVVLIAGLIVFSVQDQKRRLQACRDWCTRSGWALVGSDRSLSGRWHGAPFDVGRSRRASEVVTGRFRGHPVTSFGYQYTTGSGKNQHTVRHHVVAMALPVRLPTLQLTNDGFGASLAKSFGGQDIQFESVAFNEAWRVESPDPRTAHAVLHPRLMERLLAPDARRLSIRIEGSDVLCWVSGRQQLEAIAAHATVLADVVGSVPRFVWQEHGYDPVDV